MRHSHSSLHFARLIILANHNRRWQRRAGRGAGPRGLFAYTLGAWFARGLEGAMAVISNGREGATRLAVEIEVSRPVRESGLVRRGCVALNSCLDLVLAEVVFVAGEAELFSQEVLLQSGDLRAFADGVLQLLTGQVDEVALDIGSPELGLSLRRHDRPVNGRRSTALMRRNAQPRLSLLAYVDIGVMAGADTVSRAGPAMLLEPTVDEARQFGRDLRSEVELVLCL